MTAPDFDYGGVKEAPIGGWPEWDDDEVDSDEGNDDEFSDEFY